MSGQRHKRDELDFDLEHDSLRGEEKRRSRSRSHSRPRRHRARDDIRSRSRSLERRRRRRRSSHSRSRSGSRSHAYSSRRERRYSSRRQRDSRSRSRSGSRSHAHVRHRADSRAPSPSRSPMSRTHLNDRRRSRSADRKEQRQETRRSNAAQSSHSLHVVADESSASTTSSAAADQYTSLEDLPLPARREANIGAYYGLDEDEPVDKARIHREIEDKLRLALAKEGKVYPPPKQEASHPVFANDGSFLEIFKKMQEAQQKQQIPVQVAATVPVIASAASTSTAAYVAATAMGKSAPPPPIVGRRRGDKPEMTELKTVPFDPRFPNQNQTRHCYQSYVDFYRCQKIRGEGYEPCNYFKKVFTSLCPHAWVEKWDEQRDGGNFAGRI